MRIAALLVLSLLAGCETARQPYAPVRNIRYQALGAEPFWTLAIGDDRIVLRTAHRPDEQIWPRTLPRTEIGVRSWQSGEGANAIMIEARPGPCTSESEQVFEDHVSVRVAGANLRGCGGRLIRGSRG